MSVLREPLISALYRTEFLPYIYVDFVYVKTSTKTQKNRPFETVLIAYLKEVFLVGFV